MARQIWKKHLGGIIFGSLVLDVAVHTIFELKLEHNCFILLILNL
jgi:hypothetical protein